MGVDNMRIKLDNNKELESAKSFFEKTCDIIVVDQNNRQVQTAVGNVYALYVDKKIMYIGERQSDKIISRLNEHIFKCSESTHSKLHKIEEAFFSNKEVGYKTLTVEPEFERYSVEAFLIQNLKDLEWNTRDKKKSMEVSGTDDIEIICHEDENTIL